MHAYIVLSLLAGLRTEEARALRWEHVQLDGEPAARPPVPPHVAVWRSVRAHGETKTERSRRTLGLPQAAVHALRAWSESQAGERLAAGDDWQDTGLVFTTHHGAALDAANVRKMFKRVCTAAGTGRRLDTTQVRTSFVSLMSHQGVSIEEIARLVGHATTRTTEIVYRRELDPSSPPAPRSWTSSSAGLSPVPVQEPPRTCTSQPSIPGYLISGSTGDGHPADPADNYTTCPSVRPYQFISPDSGQSNSHFVRLSAEGRLRGCVRCRIAVCVVRIPFVLPDMQMRFGSAPGSALSDQQVCARFSCPAMRSASIDKGLT